MKKSLFFAFSVCLLFLCSCNSQPIVDVAESIEETTANTTNSTVSTTISGTETTYAETSGTAETTVTEEITETTTEQTTATETYEETEATFAPPEIITDAPEVTAISVQREFSDPVSIDDIVIVGDSIALGFGIYDRLPDAHVLAKGSVAARNLSDFTFNYNAGECSVYDIIGSEQFHNIYMSMGINDVNIGDIDYFLNHYTDNINRIKSRVPDCRITLLSITPVSAESSFTTNDTIDEYNLALAQLATDTENVDFIDISHGLKSSDNALKPEFSGGDGIHLAPSAYDVILSEITDS